MAGKKEPPDWDKFEVYKGEEPGSQRPAWLDRLIHYSMLLLFLAIVFGVGGTFLFLASVQSRSYARHHAFVETAASAWVKFIIGGVTADVVVLGWMYGTSRRQP